jgi:hypothetical protein
MLQGQNKYGAVDLATSFLFSYVFCLVQRLYYVTNILDICYLITLFYFLSCHLSNLIRLCWLHN